MRGLHGRGGRSQAGAQRLPHGAPGREGASGALGQSHAQGRDERGAARLGDQRAHHLLPDRLHRGPAPLSDARARPAGGDRRRGARADPGGRGQAPAGVDRLRGRGQQRARAVSSFLARPRRGDDRRRGRRRRAGEGTARGAAQRRLAGRAARIAVVPAPGRLRPDLRGALDFRRAGLSGGRARARPPQGHGPRALHVGDRRRGAGRFRLPVRAGRDHPGVRALSRHCGVAAAPGCLESRRTVSVVNLSGRGDKDVAEARRLLREEA